MSTHRTLATEFLKHAKEFQDAAKRLSTTKPFLYHPTFYCVLHSIELSLKAHLALSGFPKRCLKLLGHDLGAIVSEAHKAQAIPFLDSFARKAIKWGGKDYSKKCFEYPELMVSTHPIGRWLEIADVLT